MSDFSILLVDDDTAFRNGIEKYLKARGCKNVRTASTGETALELVRQEIPRVVFLDLYLPMMNGLKTLREMLKIDNTIHVFMLTCEDDEQYRSIAARLGALDYLTKPVTLEALNSCLDARHPDKSDRPAA